MLNRRGFVPWEAPGYVAAGNSPLEGGGHPHLLASAQPWGVPSLQHSQGRGGGCRGHADPWAGSGHTPWTMRQRHSQGAQPRSRATSCKDSPPLDQAFSNPSLGMISVGRFPAGFCTNPSGSTSAEVSFAHLQGQPLFLQTCSQAPSEGRGCRI